MFPDIVSKPLWLRINDKEERESTQKGIYHFLFAVNAKRKAYMGNRLRYVNSRSGRHKQNREKIIKLEI